MIELTFLNEGSKPIDHSNWKRNSDNKKYIQNNQSSHKARMSFLLLKVMTRKKIYESSNKINKSIHFLDFQQKFTGYYVTIKS